MKWLFLIAVLPYFFIFLSIYRNLLKIRTFKEEGISLIKVSVVVACRNEEKNLPLLLNDLSSQDYDPDLFEVIIVDDNSTDSTSEIVSGFKQIKCLKILCSSGRGKKSAIRTAIVAASGELIITTDADCRMGKRWISIISDFYSTSGTDLIIAPVQLQDKPGFSGRFRELEFLSLQGITAATAQAKNPVMCNGANLAFTKNAYLRHSVNLHNEILSGDDIFLLHSLKKEPNSKIAWLSSIEGTVTTCQSDSLSSFLNQRARWISKAGSYDDQYTLLISIVTFVTILAINFFLISGFFDQKFLMILLISLIIKSIPDYLILSETTLRYNKRNLLKWFIPSQIVYPFYVIVVAVRSLFQGNRWE
jgi:poly-beta-1,6-N-acetyl-D-glucosamine synthase